MIIDFLIQTIFAVIFFLGIAGVGSVIIGILNFKTKNIFLYLAIAFFTSLCLYIILAVPLLTYLPNKLLTLQIFSAIYFLVSFSILAYFYSKFPHKQISNFFKKNWLVFLSTIFVLVVFFLQIYQTALFDEWLHRPVVNHFVNNGGEFPFINPYNKDQNFNNSYHYGLYIPTATIQLFTHTETHEALDILKLSFAIASFLLIYGIVFQFSKNILYSVSVGIFLLFSGGLFFVTDMLVKGDFNLWDRTISFFNTPLLFLMAGITWINITLSLAFIWLMEQVFYRKAQFNFVQILLFTILLGGFYLISELFAVLIIISLAFSILINLIRKKISLTKIISISVILILGLLGIIILTGGVGAGLVGETKSRSIESVLTFRPFGQWGYPSSVAILGKSYWPGYIKSYSLAGLVAILFIIFLFFKNPRKELLKTFKKFPLLWLSFLICLLVPFFFSTVYGDINLAKLKELWPLLLYLILFYLIYKLNYKKVILIPVLILFLLSSFPMIITNYGIQWKDNERYDKVRCRENNLCYPEEEVKILRRFEKENPDKDKIILINRDDEPKLIDETNSQLEFISGNITEEFLKNSKAEYLFYNKRVYENSTRTSREVIWNNFEGYLAEGETAILRRKK
jgi:hypothetical protein